MELNSGPYLCSALICERVETTPTGYVLVRPLDSFTVPLPPGSKGEPLPARVQFTVFVQLQAGSARGGAHLGLTAERPSGLRMQRVAVPILFESEAKAIRQILNLQYELSEAGIYWLHLDIDETPLTQVAFRFGHNQVVVGPPVA